MMLLKTFIHKKSAIALLCLVGGQLLIGCSGDSSFYIATGDYQLAVSGDWMEPNASIQDKHVVAVKDDGTKLLAFVLDREFLEGAENARQVPRSLGKVILDEIFETEGGEIGHRVVVSVLSAGEDSSTTVIDSVFMPQTDGACVTYKLVTSAENYEQHATDYVRTLKGLIREVN